MKLAGLQEMVRPDGGVTDSVKPTVPVKPLIAVKVIVDVPEEPGVRLSEAGPAEIVKSLVVLTVTVTVKEAEWEREPLDPVTITL